MRDKCHFFNSFFYKRLKKEVGSMRSSRFREDPEAIAEGYKAVRRWTKGVDLFSKDFVFVPVNEYLHWALIVLYQPGEHARAQLANGTDGADDHATDEDEDDEVDKPPPTCAPNQPCLLYVDSMNKSKPRAYALLKAYLHLEYMEKFGKKAGVKRGRAPASDDPVELDLGDDYSPAPSAPAEPAQHFFSDASGYENAEVKVEFQHNGHDCGLYMLKYIEKLATHQPDLAASKAAGRKAKWEDHPELAFWSASIDEFRFQMSRDIVAGGVKQRDEKKKAKAEGREGGLSTRRGEARGGRGER